MVFLCGFIQGRVLLNYGGKNNTDLFYVWFKDGGNLSLDSLQRACTFEAELALLLRISHKYGKSGAQVLFSMGILEHFSSGKAINLQVREIFLVNATSTLIRLTEQ